MLKVFPSFFNLNWQRHSVSGNRNDSFHLCVCPPRSETMLVHTENCVPSQFVMSLTIMSVVPHVGLSHVTAQLLFWRQYLHMLQIVQFQAQVRMICSVLYYICCTRNIYGVIMWLLHHAVNFVSLFWRRILPPSSECLNWSRWLLRWYGCRRQLVFPPLHFTTHLNQFSHLKIHSSEKSEPIKHKNPKDSHYLKSNLCENLIRYVSV